ncbi:hypothetical protein M885DRAFT_616042 [Pelagophyceae sp. CCMP2097]|nr:hypothetical protein M885DRAFT_616042 [Pelagophyceae sp. CCMP2097]
MAPPGGLPRGWPEGNAVFRNVNEWEVDSVPHRVASLPGLVVRRIDAETHPCHGEHGCFATRRWEPFEILGPYVGIVRPPAVEGGFVVALQTDVPHTESLSLDATHQGNELRYVNDYRGCGDGANVSLQSAVVDTLPMQFLVVTRPVGHGEEFLTDYGEEYWAVLLGAPAPDDAPPAAAAPTARRPRAPSGANSDDEDAVVAAMMGFYGLSSDDDSDTATLDGRKPDRADVFKVRPKQAA